MKFLLAATFVCAIGMAFAATSLADEIDQHLAAIGRAGAEGRGSIEARAAADALASCSPSILRRLLEAISTDNPVAANWLRSAFERVVARELDGVQSAANFPLQELATYFADTDRPGPSRRLALSVCERVQPGFSKREIGRLLDDPEFREDAIELALAAGTKALEGGDSETARAEFEAAFEHARESAQVVRASSKLVSLGVQGDVAKHLGLVTHWWLVGPFDAPGMSGFARSFPPESAIDLQTRYNDQAQQPISWIRHHTADPLGLVNLAQAIAPAKEAVGYAYAEIDSARIQAGELRCGADDNCTAWLNGEKVFGREQWLNGTRFDRFVTPITLREGRNRLLIKVCQGPQHKDPQVTNNWSLQLRLCDRTGRGLDFKQVEDAGK
jgi:hypothetical protein